MRKLSALTIGLCILTLACSKEGLRQAANAWAGRSCDGSVVSIGMNPQTVDGILGDGWSKVSEVPHSSGGTVIHWQCDRGDYPQSLHITFTDGEASRIELYEQDSEDGDGGWARVE
jgi:hypothetical protein